ncbi:MAG: aminodeoxychorismate synthase component I [Patulibacter sp.]|nr:aminodeoxychorismate synthase component I [Patulibacter sp.]
MRTLLIDNHDSYTYNVFHLLAAVAGEDPVVIDNDAVSWKALSRSPFDAIVLSPGPGNPKRWHDFGVCRDVLRHSTTPVFGICLGHQGIGNALNGTVANAPLAMHGRLSPITHVDDGIFAGIPQRFNAVRYHSLAVRPGSLGPDGRLLAWADDGVVMGIEHRHRPICGVQFHPESIATEYGHRLFENFYARAERHALQQHGPQWHGLAARNPVAAPPSGVPSPVAAEPPAGPVAPTASETASGPADDPAPDHALRVRTVSGIPAAERVFAALFGHASHAFWLDSADAPSRLAQRSFLGMSAGPERCRLASDVSTGTVLIERAEEAAAPETVTGSIFDVLDGELQRRPVTVPPGLDPGPAGGFVGYLGYECKADAGSPNVHRSSLPDADLLRATRTVIVDHVRGETQIVALVGPDPLDAELWLDGAEHTVRDLLRHPDEPGDELPPVDGEAGGAPSAVEFRCERGRTQYLADVERCQAALVAGESYEICLTNRLTADVRPDPFTLYRILRHRNPAPFAAYLKLGDHAVASSSPERFLSVSREGAVEARPIKGTIKRSADAAEDAALCAALRADEKSQAEHLMIVDLLRNDLGRVCRVNSVAVPELMVIEQYTTVHQMISTIVGRLDEGRTPVECVRACFPGGSMTGAPKIRSMEIIDDIELSARGVYSGGLGYFGVDGSVDLSIVIRTIVIEPTGVTIGAGGAIVLQSDPSDEFDELMLKARAPMRAVVEAITGRVDPDAMVVQTERPHTTTGPA